MSGYKTKPYIGVGTCKYGCGKDAKFITSSGHLMCSTHHLGCDAKKKQRINTLVSLYGVDNPLKKDEFKLKAQNTMEEKYGVRVFSKHDSWKDKCTETYQENYGVDHIFYSADFRKQAKKTNLEKYGVENVFQSDEIKEKIKSTNIERYGVDNPFKSEEIQKKQQDTMVERYGVHHNWSNGSPSRPEYRTSLKETQWLESLQVNDRQVSLKGSSGKIYTVDGYDSSTRTIFEYLGAFWHGHPLLYKPEDINPVTNETFKFMYEKVVKKFKDLEDNNYKITAIWENGDIYGNETTKSIK